MVQISYDWVVPGRVIYILFEGEQTLEQVQQVADIFIPEAEINGLPPYSHAIFDITRIKVEYSAIQARKILAPLAGHPKMGWFIQISSATSMPANIVTNVIFQMARARFRMVKTLAEATNFLKNVDTTLPDLSTADFSLPPIRDIYDWPILQPNSNMIAN